MLSWLVSQASQDPNAPDRSTSIKPCYAFGSAYKVAFIRIFRECIYGS